MTAILTLPDPRLRCVADPVGRPDDALAERMLAALLAENGAGLAAPQLGVSQRVIAIAPRAGAATARRHLDVWWNPHILHRSTEMVAGTEQCLSVPGRAGKVRRHYAIEVEFWRHVPFRLSPFETWKPAREKLKGWAARVAQHEIDHLDGILFIDRAEQTWEVTPSTGGP